jgi:hypothetical protein
MAGVLVDMAESCAEGQGWTLQELKDGRGEGVRQRWGFS